MNGLDRKDFGFTQHPLKSFDEVGFSSNYDDIEVLIERAEYGAALRVLDAAIALNPMDEQPWVLRGVVLVYLDRYEDAIASCDRALVYSPNHPEAWKFRGLALHALNRYREAHTSYERALGITPSSPIQKACQWLRHRLGKPENYDYQALLL